MVSAHDIRATCDSLLSQKLIPGYDDKEIDISLKKIRDSLSLLDTTNSQQKIIHQGIIFRLQSMYDRTRRLMMSPNKNIQRVQQGIMRLHGRLESILLENCAFEKSNILVSLAAANALGLSIRKFRHIPYGVLSDDAYTARKVMSAASAKRLDVRLEKRYYLPMRISAVLSDDWNLKLVGAYDAWDTSRGEGVRVGVADTGADYNHPEISSCFKDVKGYNFVNNTDDPLDDEGHGTHVSGTIAGRNVGVAPGCTLYALKFLNAFGSGLESDFIRAAEWAIDNELDILNGSFGSSFNSNAERAICTALRNNGIIFAAAAGNNGSDDYSYPASYDTVISVAAVDKNKKVASFSQHNDQVSISSPGVDIYSCIPDNNYGSLSGTSMATPHVCGGLSLVYRNKDPESIILLSAEKLGDSNYYGKGLLRCDKAVKQ